MMNWWYGYNLFFPGFFWVIFWIVIISVFWGGRSHRWRDYSASEKSAEEILADRFAHGEINQKEYEDRLAVLQKHRKKT